MGEFPRHFGRERGVKVEFRELMSNFIWVDGDEGLEGEKSLGGEIFYCMAFTRSLVIGSGGSKGMKLHIRYDFILSLF